MPCSETQMPQQTCYNSNVSQLLIMSFSVFACPGMFNALNSIGLGGDPTVGKIVNACLYGTWMVTSFFAPTLINILGAKWALMLGTLGYPLYALAMYYHLKVWAILAGCILGITAGLLWTAQGQLMMSYPSEDRIGRFISIFWTVFNSGGVLGCFLSFVINFSHYEEGSDAVVGSSLVAGTYWTFFSIMCSGCLLALAVLPLERVTRKREADGVVEMVLGKQEDPGTLSNMEMVRREFRRTCKAFRRTTLLLFIPLFFYSNFFYAYHFGVIGALFNGRTESLTAASYWIAQIFGSILLQALLDWTRLSKTQRMYGSFALIVVYVGISWAFGGYIQYSFEVDDGNLQGLDFNGRRRNPMPAMACIFFWGFVDSFVQVWSYWMMAQLSSEPEDLACFTAFYKLWQNAGAFVSFLLGLMPGYTHYCDYWVNVALILLLIAPTLCAISSTRTHGIHSKQGSSTRTHSIHSKVSDTTSSVEISDRLDSVELVVSV
jgi:hypothetical protein